tara:strand:- start:145 stop:738 length:594 start_codon:yes stop_codon:yes gene_type:complete
MLNLKQRKLFFILSFFMGIVVIASNYLVQFPVNFYQLKNVLTYGAFSYPITFLITDLANRAFGKKTARYVVLIGFFIGIVLTLFVSTNFEDIISVRIAIGSATAFIIAQNLDVNIFDVLRNKKWYVAPLTSSILGSIIDTFLFFSIAFYSTDIPWVTLALGDLVVKLIVALIMLIPFRILISKINDITDVKVKKFNY